MLAELLHFMMHEVLNPVPHGERPLRASQLAQEYLEPKVCISRGTWTPSTAACFVVDREAAGKGFAELNGTECSGEGEEFGDVCEVA